LGVPYPEDVTSVTPKAYVDAKSHISAVTVQYLWNDGRDPVDPGNGYIASDAGAMNDMAQIRMSKIDQYGNDVPNILVMPGDRVVMVDDNRSAAADYVVTASSDNTTYITYDVVVVSGSGSNPAAGNGMLLIVYPSGGDELRQIRKYEQAIGDGTATSFTITHSLSVLRPLVQVYLGNDVVTASVTVIDELSLTVSLEQPIALDEGWVVIIG
jgi:hypothetical protein